MRDYPVTDLFDYCPDGSTGLLLVQLHHVTVLQSDHTKQDGYQLLLRGHRAAARGHGGH